MNAPPAASAPPAAGAPAIVAGLSAVFRHRASSTGPGQVVKLRVSAEPASLMPQTLRAAITGVKRVFQQATIRNPDGPIGFKPLPGAHITARRAGD